MSIKLRELIRQVRQCKSASEERKVIAKELANIRTAFREKGTYYELFNFNNYHDKHNFVGCVVGYKQIN